ncbi:MAG: apolipoprotein N-acyltransferase [Acidobacteriota bacterium]|nr:apolipoprotein N-acyltransferase [Acidobacteriota bacterium]
MSFPKFGHPALGWIALSPLILAIAAPAPPRAGRFGFLRGPASVGLTAGIVYFGGTLYWLVGTMRTFGGLPIPIAVLACAALVLVLSLYVALFAWLLARAFHRIGPGAVWMAPFLWVGCEYLRSWVGGGFPWVLLGYSQATVLPIAQVASVGGVYLLSFVVALVSAAGAWTAVSRARSRWILSAGAIAAVIAAGAWGALRVRGGELTREGDTVRVGLVQGNILQDDKWNPSLALPILNRYLDLSRQALSAGAQVVIWPESSTPFFLEENPVMAAPIRRLAMESKTPFVIGSDQIERAQQDRFYNAAFLVTPDGQTRAVYRKMHLVPFGEYVPLRQLLPFVAPLVEAVSEFSPGLEPVLLPIGEHKLSVAICYEVVYPWLMRTFANSGSGLLTTITNDAWYGTSSAAYQHWEQASLRAIEQGRYLARAANTGISGIVDPYGRVIMKTRLFETTVVTGDVRWITAKTVYATIGDLIAWVSLAVMLAAAFAPRKN